MPIYIEQLDSSASEENVTLLLGSNILLKITENAEAKSLMAAPLVEKLTSTKDLCSQRTVDALRRLMDEDENYLLPSYFQQASWRYTANRLRNLAVPLNLALSTRKLDEKLNYELTSHYHFMRSGSSAKRTLQKHEKSILELEEHLRKLTGLELLIPSVVIVCPFCKSVVKSGEFKGTLPCPNCTKEMTRSQAKRLPTHAVAESIKKVWDTGLWFEAYFARLLRNLGWKTWVNVYMMGSSGVSHEIDTLAIKEGNIIVVECKTGKVTRNDVFNFLTKAQDLKAHTGVLALLGELPEKETRDFVKKNRLLAPLENMRSLKESETLERLKAALG
jgi:Holliday junction resolvase/predicted RNA-binding Zn-ribbon protein involved in translation (DUF1610 family)